MKTNAWRRVLIVGVGLAAGTWSACIEMPTRKQSDAEKCAAGELAFCNAAACARFDAGELPPGCLDGGGSDAATDIGPDTGADTGPDTAADSAADAGKDTVADTGGDAPKDTAADTGGDAPKDTGPDAAADVAPQCVSDGDCEALVTSTAPCEVPRCSAGTCELGPADEGTPCDNGDPCTTDGVCDAAGTCQPGGPVPYDDSNDWVVTASVSGSVPTSGPKLSALHGLPDGTVVAGLAFGPDGGVLHTTDGAAQVDPQAGLDGVSLLAKINASGGLGWTVPLYGGPGLLPISLEADEVGAVYAGWVGDGPTPGYSLPLSQGVGNSVLSRFTSNGDKAWAVNIAPSTSTGDLVVGAFVLRASGSGAGLGFFARLVEPLDVTRVDLQGQTKITIPTGPESDGLVFVALDIDWTGVPSPHYVVFPVGHVGVEGHAFLGFPAFRGRPDGGLAMALLGTTAIVRRDESGASTEALAQSAEVRLAVCAFDNAGGVAWASETPMGELLLTSSYEVAVAPASDGGAFAEVNFMGSVHVETDNGSVDATNQDAKDELLIRFGPNGDRLWGTVVGGAGYQSAQVLETEPMPLIGGTFDGTLTLGDTEVTGTGAFVARLDSFGHPLWVNTPLVGEGITSVHLASAGDFVFVALTGTGVVSVGAAGLDLGTTPTSALVRLDRTQWETCP